MAGMLDNKLSVAELPPHRFWTKHGKNSDERDGASAASVLGNFQGREDHN